MATFVIMVIRLQVIFMFLKCADCQMLSTCLLPIYNQECDLNCTTADQLKLISFYKLPDGTNPIGQCLGINCQISNVSLTSKYSIQSTDSTTTTFRINELSWDDKGTWRCDYDNTPDTTDLGFAKFPDEIEYSGLSNNSDIESGTVMPITMKCLYTEIPTLVTLIYQSTGGTARSIPVTCTDTTSSCANNNFVSKLCMPIIQVGTGVVCDGNYSIEIATSVLGNEERKYSLLNGITIKCRVSKADDDETSQINMLFVKVNLPTGAGSGGCSRIIRRYRFSLTITLANLWLFNFVWFGNVVYGIEIVLLSAVINIVTIIFGVVVLLWNLGKYNFTSIWYFFLLAGASSVLGVLIYLFLLFVFRYKKVIHIKFKNKEQSKKLSSLGMELTNDPFFIYFKVKAVSACITLHIIEHMKDLPPKIYMQETVLLRNGCSPRKGVSDCSDNQGGTLLTNASYTESKSMYLKCENKTITMFDDKDKEISQWTSNTDSIVVEDIEMACIKQDDDSIKDDSTKAGSAKDDSTKDDSTKDDSTKDDSTKDDSTEKKQGDKHETPAEWIFWFRKEKLETLAERTFWFSKGYSFYKEDTCTQVLKLICVTVLPIAWFVMICLMLNNCLKSNGENTTDIELEASRQKNKKQKG